MARHGPGAFTAYLIDPHTRTIEPVEMPGGARHLQDIYQKLDCKVITAAPLCGDDSLYCDDEGLMHGPVYQFFGVAGFDRPIAGRGLVVGIDDDGEDKAPTLTLDEVTARTFFVERLGRDLWMLQKASSPRVTDFGDLADVVAELGKAPCHG